MFDPALSQIQEIILLILDSDHSQDLFPDLDLGTFNQPIECYYCHRMGHTANNCFRCQNKNVSRRQPNQR